MSLRAGLGFLILWFASILAVGVIVSAQARPRSTDEVIPGADIGFRPDRWNGDTPVGTLVVRINGQWVEASFGIKPRPVQAP